MDRLTSMRAFQCVVDEGGFAAAARSLDMSPPMVTRLVADLEKSLGARLMHRSTRRVTLTDVGEKYLSRVRSILLEIAEADAVVSAQTNEQAGCLRIGAPPLIASNILAPVIANFRELYPRILFDVDVDAETTLSVENNDITLLSVKPDFDANVIARRIVQTHAILVASPAYLQQHGVPESPLDLLNHKCLRLRLPGSRPEVWQLTRVGENDEVVDINVTPVLCSNHIDTLVRTALDGGGITSTTVGVAASMIESGKLVRVLHPWITGRFAIFAALPSRKFIPERTRLFLDYLVAKMQERVNNALRKI